MRVLALFLILSATIAGEPPRPEPRMSFLDNGTVKIGDDDWGVGVASGDICVFHGGLFGKAGSHDVRDSTTTYLAPVRKEGT